MHRSAWVKASVVCAVFALAGCGGNDNVGTGPHFVADIAVPNVKAGSNFSFDIGTTNGNRYYFTDRNNAAVDVIDIPTRTFVKAIQGSGNLAFAGLGSGPNSTSGPDGATPVGSLIYTGDVNSVKIVDPAAGAVLTNIPVSATGVRADEGCLDSTHGIFMISSPEEPTPFATFISTTTQSVIAKVTFTDAAGHPTAGLEACVYDAASDNFYVNVDGSTANPHGELVKLPGATIRAIPSGTTQNYTALSGVAMYPEGNCDPTGLALGPGTDIAVGCREATTGSPLLMQIFNRASGALVASLTAGGGDQLEYDAATNRYYNATSRWTASGNASTNGTCTAASPCKPMLTIVDAGSRSVAARLNTGNNAHSVAIDPATGLVFVPYSSATAPAGCPDCASNGFVNGGVSVFAAR
ncbi:beta-propeller fold lactonase family protein [Paraburkholderia elongata]|uniref:Uncharacterized protein n=1 Tax=Paraburkholderia elongata TaxID=2675747 RepID=A0A972P1A6_9BURK|nr:hypothetical protein [Paraburkholderia elongata]NPT61502.1 hypothetical protein [Paraburkholderia elongata]